jgi:hypothetical protein
MTVSALFPLCPTESPPIYQPSGSLFLDVEKTKIEDPGDDELSEVVVIKLSSIASTPFFVRFETAADNCLSATCFGSC